MARYTGPKHKLARREGINILDKQSASLQRRLAIPPGVHGRKRARRPSEFGQQLREKQKLKAIYGILEKQLVNLVEYVSKQKGETGEMLITLLETRLDNIVYRLGFAKSRYQARQYISHGHILVNGKKITIPSYHVIDNNIINFTPKMEKNSQVAKSFEEKSTLLPYLEREGTIGKLTRYPKREDVEVPFNTQLIIEYYSR